MSNIDKTGAPAIYFHDYPHIMEHDAYSGDYGLGFFGSSLEACSTFVVHPSRGPLCFLCNLGVEEKKDGTVSYSIEPRDSYRQRVYLEPLGLYLQADSGTFEKVSLKMSEKRIEVTFAAVTEQTYTTLRLRVDKLVVPPTSRPVQQLQGALARGRAHASRGVRDTAAGGGEGDECRDWI